MAQRFSGCGYAFDRIDAGIEACAAELAEADGWRADRYSMNVERELADRYLEAPRGASYTAIPTIPLQPAA